HGTVNGEEKSFTTLPTAPHANTEPAEDVKRTQATLTGKVTPNDSEVTQCYFEWGTNKDDLTESTNCAQSVPAGGEPSEPVNVSANIGSLAETTTYYFRLVAKNAYGEDVGGKQNFETLPAPPHANVEGAKFIERTTATLWGYARPNDSKITSCVFEYGIAPNITKSVPCENFGVLSGEGREEVRAPVEGLQEGTEYAVRLVVTNGLGSDSSENATFETLPAGPNVVMHFAHNVTATSAELVAAVNPKESPTECYFEWGTTQALGHVAPCENSPGEGDELVKVHAKISGLTPNTTYQVRVEAFNEKGSDRGGEGEHHNFTTAEGNKGPIVNKVTPKKASPAGGNTVKINGDFFEEVTAVDFGFAEAEIVKVEAGNVNKEGFIEVIAPPGAAGTVDITVFTAHNGSSEITSKDHYQYGKSFITSLTPNEGPAAGGTEVTVEGAGFELAHGTEFVFGKVKATSVECTSSTSCVVIAPPAQVKLKHKVPTPKLGAVSVYPIVNGVKGKGVKFTYK
ncbi:MAG TPA: IPT/TIG domain-containing protein, partial [Solirubrobacteraceae bacterium]|nr:IPT/TIG domain-containing protein [Solirubrobacteraceae bacterium]